MMITQTRGSGAEIGMQVQGEMGDIGKCIGGFRKNLLFGDGDSEIWF